MALSLYTRRIVAAGLVAAGVGMLLAPAAAQFFDERFPMRGGGSIFGPPPGGMFPPPFQQQAPRPADYSKAPPPKKYEKNEAADLSTIVIMGDSMADYLAYGLEQALADSPEIAVVRKPRTFSSLIYNQTAVRNRNTDWPVAAREILAKENASFVVMMIGLGDREPIREQRPPPPAPGTTPPKAGTPAGAAQPKPAEAKPAEAKPAETPSATQQSPAPSAERGSAQSDAEAHDTPAPQDEPVVAVAEQARGGTLTHEFRSEKWVEFYSKRVDETIAALKSKGVPVFWVGMPPVRGARSMSEMAFLNDIFRARAEKAGAIYIDVWDGFVDEGNRFAVQGPDFEGQVRRLRTADGVHFTQAGARKLAHYLEKEIRRAMTPSGPVAIPIPVDPAASQPIVAAPGSSATPRPLAGPVIPLNASSEPADSEELAGASGARQSLTDAVASRVLIRGEALPVPAGRADDYVWPRRVPLPVGADPVVATTTLPMTPMVAERPASARAASVAAAQPGTARPPRAPRPPGAVVPGQMTAQAQAQAQAAQREAQNRRVQQQSPFFFFFAR
jgi:hypothetical protein